MMKQLKKAFGKTIRFHTRNANPEIAGNSQYLLYKFFKINIIVIIGAKVNAGKYHLLKTIAYHLANIFKYLLNRTTDGSATHLWNDAVGAKIVAAILNLNECTGVGGGFGRLIIKYILFKQVGVGGFA